MRRRFPIGAEPAGAGVDFRVWAPAARRVFVELEPSGSFELDAEGDGYFRGLVRDAAAGALYRFRLDDGDAFPDPASRFQPEGPFGPSQVVDPAAFDWSDGSWPGPAQKGHVVYEMHVGTFTREGTWTAAAEHLPFLRDVGVTILEVMPVADFPGEFGWGYDGVNLFAPTRLYGTPDEFRGFVDLAHASGLAVILDVVYNHFGPAGNFIRNFSAHYVSERYQNEWGDPIDFEGPHSGPVREFFLTNAAYWIDEFHLDGLRLDATQQIFDASTPHVLTEIAARIRTAAGGRRTWTVVENEPQNTRMVRPPERGGHGFDAAWNDDFHHTAIVALTGRHDAYYTGFLGKPQEFVSAATRGFLYQGQPYSWQRRRRGTPALDIDAHRLVCYLENHDQIANTARGERLWRITDAGSHRAMTALLLLGPWTPMLFQGQEFDSTAPFLYFADHEAELARAVAEGRRKFLSQFRSLATREMERELPLPHDRQTLERCKLDNDQRTRHAKAVRLHRDLLGLRRDDAAFAEQNSNRIAGSVLADETFLLRWILGGSGDRLLIVNLGRDLHLDPVPEPLLAPPEECRWDVLWSSESPEYGGAGTPEPDREGEGWHIRGRAAIVLAPRAVTSRSRG
ncbi:MAG: malto-oligosyltrehalose trehalohydrolase [Thermoanaerobaculia bacterium]